MAGFDKYESILKLFSRAQSMWTVAEMAEVLDLSTSTAYRLVRELTQAGFVEATVDSRYRLGPAFVEFDRILRDTDPLVGQGSPVLKGLVDVTPIPAAMVLCRLYGEQVMCVADERSPQFRAQTSYRRGQPMPITRGATSKAILAKLDGRRRTRLLKSCRQNEDGDIDQLTESLKQVRRSGYSVTRGEVDPGLAGIAAPIVNTQLGVLGSLSLVVDASALTAARESELVSLVVASAGRLTTSLDEAYAATH
ncbi:MAG: IclR family transcriptional regulator [Cohaesibacteraceae bacterium]